MREIKFRVFEYWEMDYNPEKRFNNNADINQELDEDRNFMQFTWLKDKNWKEIYEGDLVDLFPEYTLMWTGYEIKYHWCSFKIDCWLTPYNSNIEEINHKIEVIWNIYENPDLLNYD